jgi:NAD(P)-dependent dehydrogenase (short-subunit alcohol dehydrogenase family)
VTGHVIETNPAHSVRGPRYTVKKGKTPVLTVEEAHALLESIPITKKAANDTLAPDQPNLLGLRDRALIAIMVYSFARVGAIIQMKVGDYFVQGRRRWVRLHEKGQMAYPGMSVYATTKWGIEGFFEGVIPEIAKFGIEVTLVEPGAARTNIASSSDDTTPMEIYEDTPVGDFRRAIALHGEKILIGDPVKMAQAMIASCELKPAPRRLVLGSDAYQHIEASLVERLALLRSQKELAFSTDLSS